MAYIWSRIKFGPNIVNVLKIGPDIVNNKKIGPNIVYIMKKINKWTLYSVYFQIGPNIVNVYRVIFKPFIMT